MRFAIVLLCALVCGSTAVAGEFGRYADRIEARIGGAFYDTGLLTNHLYNGGVVNGEFLLPSLAFLKLIGAPRPYLGFDAGIADEPIHFLYAGLTWDYHLTRRLYLSGSVGGAINTAEELDASPDTRSLGTRATFHVGAAIGYDFTPAITAQIYTNHFSNAYLSSPNDGHDSSGVRLGFRF